MATAAERLNERARDAFGRIGRTVVYEGELPRHRVYTRVLHWIVAVFFFLALFTGFGIYTPWAFHWLTPIFGGGPMARLLHPWFGLGFVFFFFFQFVNWLQPMTWKPADSRWIRNIKGYITKEHKVESEDVGFFNAGQKVQFWEIGLGCIVLLITGVLMWFPSLLGRIGMAVSYIVHDIFAIIMLLGIFVHVYLSTFGEPQTFRGMTRGTVTEPWAWTHHPGWYREVTGRDPSQALEEERRRMIERKQEPGV